MSARIHLTWARLGTLQLCPLKAEIFPALGHHVSRSSEHEAGWSDKSSALPSSWSSKQQANNAPKTSAFSTSKLILAL
ncbi:hypothetical protein AV530_014848 [Patagioenas fasciata monilis]|uniref:Uncharacterized protein n=1 Tax=Patagioenas fasciata monilis TaxID=372326 RepID=A0A1V4L0U1_PATFA|nr:hypothetical protein AV530_014848 [Patagioenas fasciata monilis]